MQDNPTLVADPAPQAAWMAADATWRSVSWPAQTKTAEIGTDRLNYVDIGTGDLPVLFLHGLGGNWTAWLENLHPVARHHRVVAPDLPGFGKSRPSSGGI